MMPLATLCADCAKETCVREKPGTVDQLEGRGESVSSSVTDDQPGEETNLLPTARRDDDCLTPVNNFPREVLKPLENLGEGIFGEVSVFHVIFRLFPCSRAVLIVLLIIALYQSRSVMHA